MRIPTFACSQLPTSLLVLLFTLLGGLPQHPSTVVYAQDTPVLLNGITSFSINTSNRVLSFSLPSSAQPVVLSIELCTQVDGQDGPKFFVAANTSPVTSRATSRATSSTRTAGSSPSTAGPLDNSVEIDVSGGVGYWNSVNSLENGGSLQVQLDSTARGGPWRFTVGLSIRDPLHLRSDFTPLFGDSTGTSAVLFSPPLPGTSIPLEEPTFPKYELPDAIPVPPSPPSAATSTNNTLLVIPTTSLIGDDGYFRSNLTSSTCFLESLAVNALNQPVVTNSSLVLVDQEEGWRTRYVVSGLQPQTNYTVYTISTTLGQSNVVTLSQPAYFKTKTSGFGCTLVHSLPFCPKVAYAAPFPPLTGAAASTGYDSTNFPPGLQQQFVSSLGNFTASMKTFRCGQDLYSITQSCASCERAYRDWLCSVLIPRCGEVDPSPDPNVGPIDPPAALVARVMSSTNTTDSSPRVDQTVFGGGGAAVEQYNELLPCLETCHAVDRACPPVVQWRCPRKQFGAERSYAVGYVDNPGDDFSGGGVEGGGTTGRSQDEFGNVWCNAIGFARARRRSDDGPRPSRVRQY
ncbi:stretch-activated cation channel mid1 [Serendipita sp. 399]|nr:stretch-activated cation channel mid1 [Serendipita sp. 399]